MLKRREIYETTDVVKFNANDAVKLACCDCGLVHKITVAILDDNTCYIEFVRDPRATARRRRLGQARLIRAKRMVRDGA